MYIEGLDIDSRAYFTLQGINFLPLLKNII